MGLFQSKAFNPLTDLSDLSGKVIIVTGGKCITQHKERRSCLPTF